MGAPIRTCLSMPLALACAAPAEAAAPKPVPSLPAILQYVEVLPTSGGDVASGGSSVSMRRPLPSALAKKIDRLGGPEAAQLKTLVASTGAPRRSPPPRRGRPIPLPSGGPVAAAAGTVDEGGSHALEFVFGMMLATALIGAGVAVSRARRR